VPLSGRTITVKNCTSFLICEKRPSHKVILRCIRKDMKPQVFFNKQMVLICTTLEYDSLIYFILKWVNLIIRCDINNICIYRRDLIAYIYIK
jgi:hypothetical protein